MATKTERLLAVRKKRTKAELKGDRATWFQYYKHEFSKYIKPVYLTPAYVDIMFAGVNVRLERVRDETIMLPDTGDLLMPSDIQFLIQLGTELMDAAKRFYPEDESWQASFRGMEKERPARTDIDLRRNHTSCENARATRLYDLYRDRDHPHEFLPWIASYDHTTVYLHGILEHVSLAEHGYTKLEAPQQKRSKLSISDYAYVCTFGKYTLRAVWSAFDGIWIGKRRRERFREMRIFDIKPGISAPLPTQLSLFSQPDFDIPKQRDRNKPRT
jgi:hypothetical protein